MASPITLALAGDVMLGRIVDRAVAEHGAAYPWGNLRPTLAQADAVLINLECALTTQTREWTDDTGARKAFYFRTEPERGTACLHVGHVACASLANNHAGDFGSGGLLETVAALDAAGVPNTGAGRNVVQASHPARFEVPGTRVAMVAFTDHPAAWAATPDSPGINYLPRVASQEAFDVIGHAITMARADADLVVCSLHWGPNMRPRPTPEFRMFVHHVLDTGADILFGHSAHLVHGVELYHGKPILYDTGDFIDDYAVTRAVRNDLSALFLLRITAPVIERVEALPVRISHCQVNQATGPDRDWFVDRFTALCAEMGTEVADDGTRLVIRLPVFGTPKWSSMP